MDVNRRVKWAKIIKNTAVTGLGGSHIPILVCKKGIIQQVCTKDNKGKQYFNKEVLKNCNWSLIPCFVV